MEMYDLPRDLRMYCNDCLYREEIPGGLRHRLAAIERHSGKRVVIIARYVRELMAEEAALVEEIGRIGVRKAAGAEFVEAVEMIQRMQKRVSMMRRAEKWLREYMWGVMDLEKMTEARGVGVTVTRRGPLVVIEV